MWRPPPELGAGAARPVLILSADVGEGHLAAARALEEDLTARGVPVVHQDGLVALGRVARAVIRDGYRFQLRVAPWSYSFMYAIFNRVAPLRIAGEAALCRLGRRRLLRIVARADPAVVVSTHPAITAVLGRLRQRRRLGIPVVAPITDLADYGVWSHPGADVHLVMHPDAVAEVERRAGRGSAVFVGPLVAPRFRVPRDRAQARAQLCLGEHGALVAVSGGGWGVGDLAGGAEAALAAGAAHVVVVAGRNDAARDALRARFAADPRVAVWGFTNDMDVLLRAADALVHSTGGVTSLEALSCGCPMVAYGASAGHIKVHNATMARLGLILVADDRADLQRKLSSLLTATAPPAWRPPPVVHDAAAVVASALPRIRPLPVWRTALGAAALPLSLVTLMFGALGTDDSYTLTSKPLELRPITQVASARGRVGVVVRATGPAARAVARRLGPTTTVTFAVPARALLATAAAVRAEHDAVLPALPRTAPMRWLTTRAALGGSRYYLAPDGGSSVGQYLLARSAHATALAGQVRLPAGAALPAATAAGDLVVVDAAASPAATAATVRALARELSAHGLRSVAVSSLLAARTAGAASSTNAQATTTANPNSTNNG